MRSLSSAVMARCDALALVTETPGIITRTYLTDCHKEANRMVGLWMEDAGMTARVDAVGSVIGRYAAIGADAPVVILGSHLDSVRNAGRYDGILGVLLAISVVGAFHRAKRRFPFAIEVVGFGEEEGVRFGTSLIGSHALAGAFQPAWLAVTDEAGVSLAEALRAFGLDPAKVTDAAIPKERVLAYLEAHIEQGPVLEKLGLPVGVVSAICGATRRRYKIVGQAGHAGTVPMDQRQDALTGAAEMLLAIEAVARTKGVVATVGRLAPAPDAVNVIPGAATFTLDLRAERDEDRLAALAAVDVRIEAIAKARSLSWDAETFHASPAVHCAAPLQDLIAGTIADQGWPVHRLASGAGHDAMAIADLAPVAMLFIRCRGGISHNPAEAVLEDDVAAAAAVLAGTLERLAGCSTST